MRYSVLLLPEPEIGGYAAYVPAIPGCVSQGETVEEALAMATDAAGLILAVMSEDGEDLPAELSGTILGSIDVAMPDRAGSAGLGEPIFATG